MADVKYSGRSYGRPQESAASRAFDEAFAKPKPRNMKWGNASYSKSRNEEAPESKKPKLDMEEPSDPFSFDFDSDKSPRKKANTKLTPTPTHRTVVMQPAVRIASVKQSATRPGPKSALDDEAAGNDFQVKKETVRTYSRRNRKVKEEQEDSSQEKIDQFVKPVDKSKQEFYSTDSSMGTPETSVETPDIVDLIDDAEGDLYIEKDDGLSLDIKDESFLIQEETENIFIRPKREPRSMTTADGEEVTVRFRSQYLNPEVYSKFTENVKPKDPVGRLSNSKVVHKNVLKHDSGTTLIVVCSPKVGNDDLKQSNTQSKYFKDNIKDLVKSRKKQPESLAKRQRAKVSPPPPEKDPYEMEDDVPTPSTQTSETLPESPIIISSATEESQSTEEILNAPSTEIKPVDEIVKSVKAAPPKKYHRIFRSRNKGYMEPQPDTPPETESSQDTPANSQTSELESTDLKSESEIPAVETEPLQDPGKDTPEDSQELEECMKLPVLANVSTEETDSDIDSSQQSAMSDSQGQEADSSSQEVTESQPKRPRSVKAPPAERKIFRARGNKGAAAPKKIFSSPKKAAAVYNVRSWQDEEDVGAAPKTSNGESQPVKNLNEPPKLKPVLKKPAAKPKPVPPEMPRLTRAVHWQGKHGDDAYTSVHVNKEHKELFTIVKNVKEAHECQEFGEVQEFDDDIEYLLAGIEPSEPMSTRCLSCIGLAQKSTIPAFRMHLRAHGTVAKIFGCLQDAASDPSLAVCTSTLMFMLSRDRLNMDLDQESLNLMLRLLGVDQQEDLVTTLSPTAARALKRNKDRVQEVYQDFLKQSGAKVETIDIECLSTGNLAMESLLSLTSRRAGEWFKEELRSLGALDHIVDTVCSCIEAVGNDVRVLTTSNMENLKKIDRCLRVLENVTYLNADNQKYLIAYKESCLVFSLSKALKMCQTCLSVYPLSESLATGKVDKESCGWVVYSCILAILRVLLNLTHDNDTGCMKIGEQESVMETVLLCILQSPQYVPIDLRFDLFVLSLGLLINLVEHSDENRIKLLNMETMPNYENTNQEEALLAYLSLVEVFIHREESARQLEEADEPKTPEASPNKSGEWRESDSGMEWVIDSAKKDMSVRKKPSSNGADDNGKDLDDEETFTKALHKAGKHMENSIVAAYVALLVGCLIQDSKECSEQVKVCLPEKKFDGMIYMLKKFLGFMNLTSGTGSAGGKSIERVIEVLEKC